MTFTTDIDDLIRLDRGDTKRLRNIRDVIKHDNFITSVDKKYVELSFDFNHKFRIPIYEHSEEDKNLIELLYLCSRDGADFITDKNENITEFRNKTLKIYPV